MRSTGPVGQPHAPKHDDSVMVVDPIGTHRPCEVKELRSVTFTWEQLAIDLETCEMDIDTVIAPLHPLGFRNFSQFFILADKVQPGPSKTNFPEGMIITSEPWVVIMTLDYAGDPDCHPEYAKALHVTAKQICQLISDSGSKIQIKALPDDARTSHKCLTRTPGQSVHADTLTRAFQKLVDVAGVPFRLWLCRYGLKANPPEVYDALMLMYCKMRLNGFAALEAEYRDQTTLHVAVDLPGSSGCLMLAKSGRHQQFFEGQPCNFAHYPYLGRLGQGFGGATVAVKDLKNCESCVSGFTYYLGALKRALIASKRPARKWLGQENDQVAIARLKPEFDAWRAGLMEDGQVEAIGGARLEIYTAAAMKNWNAHRALLLPVFRSILESMSDRTNPEPQPLTYKCRCPEPYAPVRPPRSPPLPARKS